MLGKKKAPEKALGKTGKEEADAAPVDSSTNAERKSMKTPGRKGRKKDQTEEDVPPVEGSANAELKPAKTSSRKSRKKDQKKDAIVLSESSVETASTNDPMPPDPKAAVPPSEAPFASNKVLHPFFSAAGRKKMAEAAPLPPEITEDGGTKVDSTIAPPRPSSRAAGGPPNKSNWGFMTGFTNSRSDRVTKAPGMADAPWPVQGTSHVRGLSPSDVMAYTGHSLGQRKLKTSSVIVQVDEDILNRLAKQLHIGCLRDNLCSDDYESRKYINVSPEVRLPKRILTTGTQLQKMIRLRISTRLPHPKAISQVQQVDSDSELSSSEMIIAGTNVHPALFRLYKRLGTELTAFDMHKCEATPWEVKYAAETIEETLQPGKEKDILKKWLIRLKTDKVHVETGASAKRKAKGNVAAAKKKRKKKDDDLDSFVVTSEEELNTMDEITDPEEEDWINPATKTKKSTVRAGDKLGELDTFLGKTKDHKKTNTIVISGPIGCGKTATVFAVAKELGYAVFEVNPGSRRNGKDVLDLVGDMSRNHLVHHAKNAPETNNPFAKVKAAKEGTNTLEEDLQMRQKQSLILFEEVDILFEEDKNFWSTVISLMAKSKRPVVLTCNDESLLPWDDLSLHAILRFSPAPRSLLVDHLLLMSANEGHLLQRSAVEALAAANKDDIRACIMDLQFYCRMAVGDRKGGLGWLVDRWPVGCDIAENGEPLRVVSEDTYYEGIGFVPNSPDIKEEDKWRDVWDEYGLDIGASEEGLEECAGEIEVKGVKKKVSLTIAHEFFEARSAADAFSSLASSGIDEVSFLLFTTK